MGRGALVRREVHVPGCKWRGTPLHARVRHHVATQGKEHPIGHSRPESVEDEALIKRDDVGVNNARALFRV
jgi:hypothetical protein